MPIYFSSSGYGYTYKKENNKNYKVKKSKGLLKFFILFLLFIMVITSISLLVYNLLDKKEFGNNINVYALKIASYNNYENSLTIAQNIKNQGGAGYININNGQYEIFVSCYKIKQDAEKVLNNLNETGYQLEIIEIPFTSINIAVNLDKKQTESIKRTINLFYDTYSQLYDISILVDTNQINKTDYQDKLSSLRGEINNQINSFNNDVGKVDISQIIYLRIYLNNLLEKIDNLIATKNNISSQIKYTYFEVIFLYQQMLQNI